MVVTCRTNQLIKTGKNVRISNKFSYSTRNTPLGIKNYVHKNSVPRNNEPKIRLYDCKKFHSSRESRMTLAKLTPQEILSCAVVESRSVEPNSLPPNNILNLVLQSQGTSVDQIRDQVIAADGNLQQAVSNINSALNEDLLNIDDNILKVNPSALQNLLKKSIQSSVQSKFFGNSSVTAVVENRLLAQLSSQSSRLAAIAEQHSVPVEVAQQWLDRNNLNRNKRSLDRRDFDLGTIISDTISSILQDQLISIVVSLLENVKTLLEGFYIVTAPGNDIGDFVASLVNWGIKAALQLITGIEDALTNGSSSTTVTSTSRKRRDVEVAVAESGEDTGSGEDQGLDLIVRPIFSIVAVVLTPVNILVTDISDTVLNILQPIIGTIIISRVRALVVAIVNLIFIANTA